MCLLVGAIRMRQQLLKHTLKNLWHFHENMFYLKSKTFWYITVYIFSKYSQIYLLKGTKHISSRYLNFKKYAGKIHCYLWRAWTYLNFIMNLLFYFYYEWKNKVGFLKVRVKVTIFDWTLLLLNFIFLSDKMHGVFDNIFISFKTKNGKVKHKSVHRVLIFQLQQEVLKFNNISVSLSSP